LTGRLFILRPEPGASQTARRAQAMGFHPIIHPLFAIKPVAWEPPDPAAYDGVMITSANAVRHGGPALARYHQLPLFAVGQASAKAAREAGFVDVREGDGGVAALLQRIADAGFHRILHLSGRDVTEADHPPVMVERRTVYESLADDDAARSLAIRVIAGDCLLVHSPRAGRVIAEYIDPARRGTLNVAAISPAALAASGTGWAQGEAPSDPNDKALLALAAQLWL